jgi:hypothetical protein
MDFFEEPPELITKVINTNFTTGPIGGHDVGREAVIERTGQ